MQSSGLLLLGIDTRLASSKLTDIFYPVITTTLRRMAIITNVVTVYKDVSLDPMNVLRSSLPISRALASGTKLRETW